MVRGVVARFHEWNRRLAREPDASLEWLAAHAQKGIVLAEELAWELRETHDVWMMVFADPRGRNGWRLIEPRR